MPNYYYKATGNYYFAGMWTAILTMIPGIYAIYRLTKVHKLQAQLLAKNRKNSTKKNLQFLKQHL